MAFETDSFNFKMSEINAVDIQKYVEKGQTKTRRVTVASGILGKLEAKSSTPISNSFSLYFNYLRSRKNNIPIVLAGIVLGIIFILFIDSFFDPVFFNSTMLQFKTLLLTPIWIAILPFIVYPVITIFMSKKRKNASSISSFNRKWVTDSNTPDSPVVKEILCDEKLQSLFDKLSLYLDNYSTSSIFIFFQRHCVYFYIPNMNLFVPKISKTTPTILTSLETDIEIINSLLELCEYISKLQDTVFENN